MLTYYILARLAQKRPKWIPKKEPRMPANGLFLWEGIILILLGLSILWFIVGGLLGFIDS